MKTLARVMQSTSLFVIAVSVLFYSCSKANDDPETEDPAIVTDVDGNVYHTVKIHNQIWMVENLRVTHFNDGTSIPNISDNAAWISETSGAYCWYNNDSSAAISNSSGALYNWYAVNSGKLCPKGWHVPDFNEWNTLISYSGDAIAGGELKESGTSHWSPPNTAATNTTGFTGVPGGFRHSVSGGFKDKNLIGCMWGATENPNETSCAWTWNLSYNSEMVTTFSSPKVVGASVRCIKNN